MRVLSQWMDIDLDYESSVFMISEVEKEKEDDDGYAIFAFNQDHQFYMASYSDVEKAKQALQLMSSTYTRYLITNHDNYMTMTDALECELDKPFNKIDIKEMKATSFQFPLEENL